jgi:uncharacterized membrane protein
MATRFTAASMLVRAYDDMPKLIFSSVALDTHDAANPQMSLRMDLNRDSMRIVPYPGQPQDVAFAVRQSRGFFDTEIEDKALKGNSSASVLSTYSVFNEAVTEGVGFAVISAANPQAVDELALSAQAKARISAAVACGKVVQTPAAMVTINGISTVAWFELDPSTGEMISVMEDGSHGSGIVWYAGVQDIVFVLIGGPFAFGIGAVAGGVVALLFEAGWLLFEEAGNLALASNYLLNRIGGNPSIQDPDWIVLSGKAAVEVVLAVFPAVALALSSLNIGWIAAGVIGATFSAGFWFGLFSVAHIIIRNLKNGVPDPSVLPFQTGELRTAFAQASADGAQTLSAGISGSSLSIDRSASSVRVTGTLSAKWTPNGAVAVPASSLSASNATVRDQNNGVVASGTVNGSFSQGTTVLVKSAGALQVNGNGSLAFFPPLGGNTGSADWQSFHAQITGGTVLLITAGTLNVGGTTLPSGTYSLQASSADISGAGGSGAPNFLDSNLIQVSNAALEVGPGSGGVSINGSATAGDQGVGATGFSGTLTVTPAGSAVGTTASGSFAKILLPDSGQHQFSTDQLSTISILPAAQVNTNGDYTFHAVAPPNWILSFDTDNKLNIQPAQGLESGTFDIHLAARSKSDPALVADEVFAVTIGATQPGVALNVVKDQYYTYPDPQTGVDLPTTFQATIRNKGPASDTFTLSFDSVPAGFDGVVSLPSVKLSSGEHVLSGLYLVPTGATLPAPGTQLSFIVRAQSVSDPSVNASQSIDFTVPDIHGIRVEADPGSVSVPPGTAADVALTFTAVGNVAEQLTLQNAASAGLAVSGFVSNVSLNPGASASQNLTLTPDAGVPLGTTLNLVLQGTYGPASMPIVGNAAIEVRVSAPGVDASDGAALNAAFLGNTALAGTLGNLSTALTSLFLNASDSVAQGQVIADLNSLLNQLDDPIYNSLVAELADIRDLIASGDLSAINSALGLLPNELTLLSQYLTLLAEHNFKILLMPNSIVASSGQTANYSLFVINSGTKTTSITFDTGPLPGNVNANFNQTSLTLAPGQISNGDVVLSLQESGTSILPFDFDVNGTVDPGSGAQLLRSAHGSLTVRDEQVQISSVKLSNAFVDAGTTVGVSAQVVALINTTRPGKLIYEVLDSTNTAVFTSAAKEIQFAPDGFSTSYSLDPLDTSGLADGEYRVRVTADEEDGTAIAGAENFAALLIGSPLQADLSIDPDSAPPGTNTVQAALHIKSIGGLGSGLELLGQTAVSGANGGFAIKDQTVYIAGGSAGNFGAVADISDPTNPLFKNTFGSGVPMGHLVLGGTAGDRLVEANAANPDTQIRIFDLTNPLSPALQTPTPLTLTNRQFYVGLVPHGDRAYALHSGLRYYLCCDIYDYWGGVSVLDVSNMTAPSLTGNFYNVSHDDTVNPAITIDGYGKDWTPSIVDVGDDVGYHVTNNAPETDDNNAANDPAAGQGTVRVFDLSDPAHPVLDHELIIPNTAHILSGSVNGNQVLLVGSSGGINDPGASGIQGPNFIFFRGHLVLTVLDAGDPLHPSITAQREYPNLAVNFTTHAAPISAGKWFIGERLSLAVSDSDRSNNKIGAALFGIADAGQPGSVALQTYPAFPGADSYNFTVHDGNLVIVAPAPAGLMIYSLDNPAQAAVSASVDVAKNNGVSIVPNSFNIEPSDIIDNGAYETLVWSEDKFPLPYSPFDTTITWNLQVDDLQPVEAREVLNGGEADFTYQGTPGAITLAPQFLSSGDVIDLNPSSQTARPGEEVVYTVTLHNPGSIDLPLDLGLSGLDPSWYYFDQPSLTLPAASDAVTSLHVRPDSGALLRTDDFSVLAASSNQAVGAASGRLIVDGEAIVPSSAAQGVLVELVPTSGSAGLSNPAVFSLRVTNTGSVEEQVDLTANTPGFGAFFGTSAVDVLPGKSNAKLVPLSLLPQAGVTLGSHNFNVTGTVAAMSGVSSTAQGVVSVVSQGVTAYFDTATTAPLSTIHLHVTNSGQRSDTFNLALAGPAGPFAQLSRNSVTLPAGGSADVVVTIGSYPLVAAGNLSLSGIVTSASASAIRAKADTTVVVPESIGLDAHFTPALQQLSLPGSTSFLLEIDNAGTSSDIYTATIVGTTGDAQAALVDQDGDQGKSIPLVRLPALGKGIFLMNASKATIGRGTITVRVSENQSDASTPLDETVQPLAQPAAKSVDVIAAIQVGEAGRCLGLCISAQSDLDEDGDGVPNCQELQDQTDPCDSGSHVTQLQPFSCAGANGFLGQVNIATVLNHQSTPLGVGIEYRDSTGELRGHLNFSLGGYLKRDIIINDLGLAPDTYGTVCVYTDAAGTNAWSGGMTLYKRADNSGAWNPDDDFDFALYYPFQSPQTGPSNWSINTNTVGTDGLGTVANWLRIADAVAGDGQGVKGQIHYYDFNGKLISTETVNVPDGGRVDYAAHTAIGEHKVGQAEFLPDDSKEEYYIETTRYFYQGLGATSDKFYTAFSLPNRPLTGAAVTGRASVIANQLGIVEMINGSGNGLNAQMQFFDADGNTASSNNLYIPQKGSAHQLINSISSFANIQSAQVSGPPESIAATTVLYQLNDQGELQFAYAPPFAESQGTTQLSEFNSFIKHSNTLELDNSTDQPIKVDVRILNFDQSPLGQFEVDLDPKGSNRQQLSLPPDTYGTIIVDTGTTTGVVVRNDVGRPFQYILPFLGR